MENKDNKQKKGIETEDLSYFDLIIGSIPFLGNGYMLCSLFIKMDKNKK